MKRILSCVSSDFRQAKTGAELKQAIIDSEGRVVMAETATNAAPLYSGVSNAELLAAFSADMILLKVFDVFAPSIVGIGASDAVVKDAQQLTGRLIGINLEASVTETDDGLHVNPKALQTVVALGADFLCITGYKNAAMTNEVMIENIRAARKLYNGLIIVNRVELPENLAVAEFVAAGADVIMMPAPGSLPGVREATLAPIIDHIHQLGAVALTTTSTSQEGADSDTIRDIALSSKRAGSDMQNLGDADSAGIGNIDNLLTLSIAIRGKRHTYVRMASSINR